MNKVQNIPWLIGLRMMSIEMTKTMHKKGRSDILNKRYICPSWELGVRTYWMVNVRCLFRVASSLILVLFSCEIYRLDQIHQFSHIIWIFNLWIENLRGRGPLGHYASDWVHFMKIVTIFFNGNEVSQSMGQLSRNVLTILNLRFDSGNYF